MKRVLLVDDEKTFLKSLSAGLSSFSSLEVLSAHDGSEAVGVLASRPIDIVITDLQMPRMGGFELLSHISRHYPRIPVIVMTAFATPTTHGQAEQLGALGCIAKPIGFDELAGKIFETLLERNTSSLGGVSVALFLQLAAMERMSCRVTVEHGAQSGLLVLSEGKLADAKLGETHGEEAAYTIVAWNPCVLSVETTGPVDECAMHHDMSFVIMESLRRADEGCRAPRHSVPSRETGAAGDPWDSPMGASASVPAPSEVPFTVDPGIMRKEDTMALEQLLQGCRDINGYKAAAIMNFTGELLAADSLDTGVDLGLVGATFNDIFRAAHEASKKIGLEATREAVFKTPKGLVIMLCSGVNARPHIHVVAVLAQDGNQALAKMRLEQLIDKASAEL